MYRYGNVPTGSTNSTTCTWGLLQHTCHPIFLLTSIYKPYPINDKVFSTLLNCCEFVLANRNNFDHIILSSSTGRPQRCCRSGSGPPQYWAVIFVTSTGCNKVEHNKIMYVCAARLLSQPIYKAQITTNYFHEIYSDPTNQNYSLLL